MTRNDDSTISTLASAGIKWRNSYPEIRTERLLLRIPRMSDAEALALYRRENWDHLGRWEPTRPRSWTTADFSRTRISADREQALAGYAYQFLMELTGDDVEGERLVGTLRVGDIARASMYLASVGYGLDHRCQGRGLMREALTAAIRFAFDDLGLHRLEASYMPANERSGRLLEHCGFQIEGLMRGSIRVQGNWEDHYLASLLNDAWKEPEPGRLSSWR
ncbi:MAG TPA: GNAT family N-acetyltransferase [Fimbriimonadaceae bacterium]|nr:GNAT family N-acetyltransferase [Fimbriimonadaceae bacterium]